MPLVGLPFGIAPVVGEAVIHRREAGGSRVAKIGHLDRCGLARHHQQAVLAGVPGKVDQDVNAVDPDQLGNLLIGFRPAQAHRVRKGLEPGGHPVHPRAHVVGKHLDVIAVVVGQDRFDERRNRVDPEVR